MRIVESVNKPTTCNRLLGHSYIVSHLHLPVSTATIKTTILASANKATLE